MYGRRNRKKNHYTTVSSVSIYLCSSLEKFESLFYLDFRGKFSAEIWHCFRKMVLLYCMWHSLLLWFFFRNKRKMKSVVVWIFVRFEIGHKCDRLYCVCCECNAHTTPISIVIVIVHIQPNSFRSLITYQYGHKNNNAHTCTENNTYNPCKSYSLVRLHGVSWYLSLSYRRYLWPMETCFSCHHFQFTQKTHSLWLVWAHFGIFAARNLFTRDNENSMRKSEF